MYIYISVYIYTNMYACFYICAQPSTALGGQESARAALIAASGDVERAVRLVLEVCRGWGRSRLE